MNHDARVGIIMGSQSDLPIMVEAADILGELMVPIEVSVVSAHRTPHRLVNYASNAKARGLKVIIAGAGGAAHLPGMVASMTPLPVIGVPINARISVDGWDSLLSIVQMPPGVPVATVAIDGAKNAGLLAAQMLALSDDLLMQRIITYKRSLEEKVLHAVDKMNIDGYRSVLKGT